MRIAIVTIQSINYGNRLQNYALQEELKKYGECKTLHVDKRKVTLLGYIKRSIRLVRGKTKVDMFTRFDQNIDYDRLVYIQEGNNSQLINKFDYFIAGSDQVWNPLFDFIGDREFLTFANKNQKIAFAASIGIDELPEEHKKLYKEYLKDFKAISMRENSGKDIIKEITGRNDIETVLDPTMLLSANEWRRISKRSIYQPSRPYIFKYVLGIEDNDIDNYIEKKALELGYEVFDLKDFSAGDDRAIGPSEFISLIENSELVFTDSFHGTVFSILFHRPFFTLQRQYQKGYGKMSSRLETLLNMIQMEERLVSTVDQLHNLDMNYDFKKADDIINEKREISKLFLQKALGK